MATYMRPMDVMDVIEKQDKEVYIAFDSIKNAFRWVFNNQNKHEGAWGGMMGDSPCLEYTYWVVKNLSKLVDISKFERTKNFVLSCAHLNGYFSDEPGEEANHRSTGNGLGILSLILPSEERISSEIALIHNARDWLLRSYDIEGGGGWGRDAGDPHDIENTYIIASALSDAGVTYDNGAMKKTIDWLMASQTKEGCWLNRQKKADTEMTAEATLLLMQVNPTLKEEIKNAINFLCNNQNDDGGWGATSQQKSAISPSSWAVLALVTYGLTFNVYFLQNYLRKIVSNALQYLLRNQGVDGSWAFDKGGLGSISLTSRIICAIYKSVETFQVKVPLSTIFMNEVLKYAGPRIGPQKPTKEFVQIILEKIDSEHYDVIIDSPQRGNATFTYKNHFVSKHVHSRVTKHIDNITMNMNALLSLLVVDRYNNKKETFVDIRKQLNDNLERLGKALFREYIPEDFQDLLINLEPKLHLLISTNDMSVPWELMRIPQRNFLSLEYSVGRKLLLNTLYQVGISQRKLNPDLDILLIGNPTGDLPQAEKEITYIRDQLGLMRKVHVKTLVGSEATIGNVMDTIEAGEFDIIHFSCHVHIDTEPQKTHLVFADSNKLFAIDLHKALKVYPPSIVFLNACSSAKEKTYLSTKFEPRQNALAAQLLTAGVQGVIGALWPIHDESSAFLASEFYKNLLKDYTIGQSLQVARKKLYEKQASVGVEWYAFVLYGNPMVKIKY